MVTKVFNFQPVLFHQYYLCRLLWFKKQSFTLVWKPNPPLLSLLRAPSRSCWCSECWLYEARAESASLHVISEIWLLLQCAVALQRADALEQQTMHLHKCDLTPPTHTSKSTNRKSSRQPTTSVKPIRPGL